MGNKKGSLRLLTQEQHDWLVAHVTDQSRRELSEQINATFGLALTEKQMHAYLKNHHIGTGRDTRFKSGHIPANKGRKGIHLSPQTEFKPGNRPATWRPVGSERLRADGYVWVKVQEPNRWRQKHVVVWEEANGPRPKGHAVIFADGNILNCSLDNLILVSKHTLLVLNRFRLLHTDPELSRSGVAVAKLITEIEDRQRGGKKHVQTRAGSLKNRQAERSRSHGNYDGAV